MDHPSPDPTKLLEIWMEWERGDTTPGRVMANLKTAGLRELLEQLEREPAWGPSHTGSEDTDPSAWTPTV